MSYGQGALSTLLHDSTVTALVTGGSDGIFYDTVVPKYYDDGSVVGATDSTINYYRIDPVNMGEYFLQTQYTINCRAASMLAAETLAAAVVEVVNRHSSDAVYFVVSVLPVIPPADSTDVYNAVIEATAKSRNLGG